MTQPPKNIMHSKKIIKDIQNQQLMFLKSNEISFNQGLRLLDLKHNHHVAIVKQNQKIGDINVSSELILNQINLTSRVIQNLSENQKMFHDLITNDNHNFNETEMSHDNMNYVLKGMYEMSQLCADNNGRNINDNHNFNETVIPHGNMNYVGVLKGMNEMFQTCDDNNGRNVNDSVPVFDSTSHVVHDEKLIAKKIQLENEVNELRELYKKMDERLKINGDVMINHAKYVCELNNKVNEIDVSLKQFDDVDKSMKSVGSDLKTLKSKVDDIESTQNKKYDELKSLIKEGFNSISK